jgi:hypothetical protein
MALRKLGASCENLQVIIPINEVSCFDVKERDLSSRTVIAG